MPKIELSFDEMITLAAACQQTAESLEHFPDLAAEYKAMRDVIHERFAAAETQERFEERCRQYGLLPDDKLPDSLYAPDPEDFCKDGTLATSQSIAPCGAPRALCGKLRNCYHYSACPDPEV